MSAHVRPLPADLSLWLADESASMTLGAQLAPLLLDAALAEPDGAEPGAARVVHLRGDLGAGKTTLVRAVLRSCGFQGAVRSPTYTLIEPYVVSSLNLYHFDFYRFSNPDEFFEAGLEEYFSGPAVCFVEWPDRAAPHTPDADLCIGLSDGAHGGRVARLAGASEVGIRCLNELKRINRLPVVASPDGS